MDTTTASPQENEATDRCDVSKASDDTEIKLEITEKSEESFSESSHGAEVANGEISHEKRSMEDEKWTPAAKRYRKFSDCSSDDEEDDAGDEDEDKDADDESHDDPEEHDADQDAGDEDDAADQDAGDEDHDKTLTDSESDKKSDNAVLTFSTPSKNDVIKSFISDMSDEEEVQNFHKQVHLYGLVRKKVNSLAIYNVIKDYSSLQHKF